MKNQDDLSYNFFSILQPKTFNILLAGGLTGAIEVSVTYPIEYTKTLVLLEETTKRNPLLNTYSGVYSCLRKSVKKRGFMSLYRGSTIYYIGSVPKTAIRFASYEAFCALTQDNYHEISLGCRSLCGLGAGMVEAVLMVTPMEAIKIKFIKDQKQKTPCYKGFIHGFKSIYEEIGIRGLYKGVLPIVIRQSSNQCIRFSVVEACRDEYEKNNPTESPPKLLVGCFGALAGILSIFASTPFDVVMTRIHGTEKNPCRAIIDCLIEIRNREGVRGLFKGTTPRIARVMLDVSVTFMCYDIFYEFVNEIWD